MNEIEDNDTPVEYVTWTKNNTKILIDIYAKYRSKVGSMEIRTQKKLWETAASKFKTEYGVTFTAGNCENRWRVLERNYKKYIDNNNKTGRARKNFEYYEEMDNIFKKKKSVHPVLLLSSNSVNENMVDTKPFTSVHFIGNGQEGDHIEDIIVPDLTPQEDMPSCGKRQIKKYRNDILEDIRRDRKKYQENILRIKENYYQKMIDIEKEKVDEKKRRNDLLEKRNKLYEDFLKKGLHAPFD